MGISDSKVRLQAVAMLLLRRPPALVLVILATIITLAHWILLIITIDTQVPAVVLHYNIYFGIDQLGSWRQAFNLPLISTVILLIDWLVAIWLMRRDHWLAYGLLWVGMVVSALALVISAMVRWQYA